MSLHSQVLFLALLAALSLPAFAQTASPGDAERDRSELERAATLRQQSSEERERIEVDRVRGEAECRAKILENRCREDLKQSLIRRENAVRAQQNEAGRLEREVRARSVAARDAAREADRPVREAEQAEQARLFREKQARQQVEPRGHALGQAEARGADKARRADAKAGRRERDAAAAAERARRAREDAARYDEKQKKHDERVREAAAKAAAQSAAQPPSKTAASAPRH
ncbi:hypothetical protein [Niveibacterium terrae]|uniref:hypothetical protein n=1 Tax=Niveibacterium terrae TaxID=3373598 RepID=UPI003A8CEE28